MVPFAATRIARKSRRCVHNFRSRRAETTFDTATRLPVTHLTGDQQSMKNSWSLILSFASLCAAAGFAQGPLDTLVVTMSNADTNQLLVYDANGQPTQTVSTQGK